MPTAPVLKTSLLRNEYREAIEEEGGTVPSRPPRLDSTVIKKRLFLKSESTDLDSSASMTGLLGSVITVGSRRVGSATARGDVFDFDGLGCFWDLTAGAIGFAFPSKHACLNESGVFIFVREVLQGEHPGCVLMGSIAGAKSPLRPEAGETVTDDRLEDGDSGLGIVTNGAAGLRCRAGDLAVGTVARREEGMSEAVGNEDVRAAMRPSRRESGEAGVV